MELGEPPMLPSPNPMDAGGMPPPPQQGQPLAQPGPNLATTPGQGSSLGGSPAGLGGSPDPRQILAKAELLLKSGAISQQQFQMIVAKLGMGGGPQGARPAPGPLTTTGVPGGGPAAGGAPPMPQPPMQNPPSAQWNQ